MFQPAKFSAHFLDRVHIKQQGLFQKKLYPHKFQTQIFNSVANEIIMSKVETKVFKLAVRLTDERSF